jgi:allophanate hydrolase
MSVLPSLLIGDLLTGYRAGRFSPLEIVERMLDEIAQAPDGHVWISLVPRERVLAIAQSLASRPPQSLPLYGIPFAIKDNIDLEGVATTAACPDYAYVPRESAHVVQKLLEAGAIPIGKTNLDQFATGLVGTRSPYGACRNSFDPDYISGGSSSGSAVAVALGWVSFALGTDTAGSGRVPAGFNNLIGLKPTRGALSTRGVLPACRSLDCVSIFALTSDDAARVLSVAQGYDAKDPYSRPVDSRPVARDESGPAGRSEGLRATHEALGAASQTLGRTAAIAKVPGAGGMALQGLRLGVPRASQLEFFADADYARLFGAAVARLEAWGAQGVEIDFEPFLATARLLYEGPWVAERYCAVGEFLESHPQALYPVTRQIIAGGRKPSAVESFRAQYRLMELRRETLETWEGMDVLVIPTAGTIYRIQEVEAQPIKLNSNLGYYTNFVNLLDLAAVAVPAGFRRDGLPFGVTLLGQAGSDVKLLTLADKLHRASVDRLGATKLAFPQDGSGESGVGASGEADGEASASAVPHSGASRGGGPEAGAGADRHAGGAGAGGSGEPAQTSGERIAVAVCGAHMEGLPLNAQLTDRGGTLLKRTRSAAAYKLYALPGGPPHRPGMIRVATGGAPIEVEVWSVPAPAFGTFVQGIPAPLGIGKIELEDGTGVAGFICEGYAADGARDITAFGGWRGYLESVSQS